MYKDKPYSSIVAHYEDCLNRFGDTHLGVDWRNAEDADRRYQVMLDVVENKQELTTLLDFGCGTAALLDYIRKNGIPNIDYTGLDISEAFIKVSKNKYPYIKFLHIDLLEKDSFLSYFDYIIMNGVFTEKVNLSHEKMFTYFCDMIEKIFPFCKKAIAFNLRSNYVTSKEKELFHLSFDDLACFLINKFGRRFIIRNDYDLEEYTVYLYPAAAQKRMFEFMEVRHDERSRLLK